jgi:hypothetical protein
LLRRPASADASRSRTLAGSRYSMSLLSGC